MSLWLLFTPETTLANSGSDIKQEFQERHKTPIVKLSYLRA